MFKKNSIMLILVLIAILAISNVSASEITTNSSDDVNIDDNLALKSVNEDVLSDIYNNSDENGELDGYYPGFEYSNMYDDAYVNLTMPNDAKGNLVVSLYDYDENDDLITTEIGNVKVIDGKASVKLPCLELKGYEFGAKYTGRDYYVDPLEEYVKIIPKIDVSSIIWINDDNYLSFGMPEGEMLKLLAYQNDNLVTNTTIKNGSKIKLDKLTCDNFYYYLEFENMDETYYAYYDFGLEVRPDNPEFELNVTVYDVIFGTYENCVNIELPLNHYYFEDMITVIIDGDKSKAIKTDSNYCYFDAENLTSGVHTVDVICEADDYYKKATASTTFNVGYIAVNVGKTYEYNGYIYVDLIDNASGYLLLYIDGNLQDVAFTNKGDIDLSLSNITTGNHIYEIKYSGDENHAPYSKTGKLNIDYYFTFNSNNGQYYGDNNQVEVLISDYATGNVILSVDGKNCTAKINEGRAVFNLPKLTAGKYSIAITYLGNDRLGSKTIHEELEVSYEILIERGYVNLTLPENAKGNLIVRLYDENGDILLDEYDVKLVNGKASVSFADLGIGTYYVRTEYTGEDYSVSESSSPIWIEEDYSDIEISVPYTVILNQDANITIKLPDKYDKSLLNVKIIDYDINDEQIILAESNGKTNIRLPTSKLGDYMVKVAYDGNDLIDDYFVVTPLNLNIPESYSDVKLGEIISVEMPEDAKGKINLMVYDLGGNLEKEFSSSECRNGKTSVVLDNLTSKIYGVLFKYLDEKYGNYSCSMRINVVGYYSKLDFTASNNKDSTQFDINLANDASGQVVLVVNGKVYDSKVNKGVATINIPKLSVKNVKADVYYSGDEKYCPITKTADVNVKSAPVIVAQDITATCNVAKNLIITLKDDNGSLLAGKTVNVELNGRMYVETTDNQGQISIAVPTNLAPKDYVASIDFAGDGEYLPNNATVNVNVQKATSVIESSNATFTYKTSKNLIITLKDNQGSLLAGKTVNIVLNGKEYAGTTDSQGQLSFAVPTNLIPNTYDAIITFDGDDTYLSGNAAVSIKVLKLTPKLAASKATFKVKTKTKKYTITLKNNKNKAIKSKKVTLKVNGKTYKATTNKKGKATFKITKLTKKGTFKAVVKYSGDKYYKTITKTVKLTVKK